MLERLLWRMQAYAPVRSDHTRSPGYQGLEVSQHSSKTYLEERSTLM